MNHKSLASRHVAVKDDPEAYWLTEARRLEWSRFPSRADESSFDARSFKIRWFGDGELNVSTNCLDRHLAHHGDKVAIIFEGDELGNEQQLTYRELHSEVCRFANALKAKGVRKGDRVVIYLPMIPEAAIAMLACARIGAIHSVVFGGFSPESLADRISDCGAKVLVTADEGRRGGKGVPLKASADKALERADVETVIVIRRGNCDVAMQAGRDVWWHEIREICEPVCPAEKMNAEDPHFILYTSGSTGTPKGVVHTTGGYLLWVSKTFDLLFSPRSDDVFWCTADVGWITGHSYVVYGPLSNATTTVIFEGVPSYPDHGRFWSTAQKHGVTIFYTAPTAIRALMREGEEWVSKYDRSKLRLLGTVGEPINPEVWEWYHRVVGEGRCEIVDTWWQTETGGALIAPVAGEIKTKPGSATLPLPGIYPALLDPEGRTVVGEGEGNLVITKSWPGQMRGLWGDPERFVGTYFTAYPGNYFTGDGCRRDDDGYFWITGRVDDVINVSGHRLGTAELESALVAHPAVAEAAIVGFPHDIKGQGIYAFVTLVATIQPDEALASELRQFVRREIGPIASLDKIQFAPALPKTRSGKIMRRILRKIAEGAHEEVGDTSTLADPGVVSQLIAEAVKGSSSQS